MPNHPVELPPDLLHELSRAGLETRTDAATLVVYSTDASIYQITPLGVAFPRTADHLNAAVELAARYNVPVLARGAGSSLAGQAIGAALILDCSRHLNQIDEIGVDEGGGWVRAQPGAVLAAINRAAAAHGLMLGPDPASGDRATLGGSLANNASGSHSIVYGLFADHVRTVEAVLGDGRTARLEEVTLAEAERLAGSAAAGGQQILGRGSSSAIHSLYATALEIRAAHAEAIRSRWPRTYRRAAGYNLNYLLGWSASAPPMWGEGGRQTTDGGLRSSARDHSAYPPVPPNTLNLAHLLVGSEGTLGVIREAVVGLVPRPRHTVLAVLSYPSVVAACDAVPALLERTPSAVELIPRILLQLAAGVPAYARLLDFIPAGELPGALLAIEFAGDHLADLTARARSLPGNPLVIANPEGQARLWAVRKAGLGILQSQPGDRRTQTFIEDLAVPVERLGEFVREMDRILAAHGTEGYYYAHASAGCLHMRPLLNLKTAEGVRQLRAIASEAVDLVIRLGGTTTGEHGDGLARSEFLEQLYGPEIATAFRRLKHAADPQGILNPGKIVDSLPMDTNLRYGADYRTGPWRPILNFDAQGGLSGAVELCNGAAVCRSDKGVMCPSFQATREELHSTRGRANLLRALLSQRSVVGGPFPDGGRQTANVTAEDLHAALDLCLACKGCKSECPSAVDMAKLKYEFTHHYYQSHRRPLRDYLFAHIGVLARWGQPLARLGILKPLMRIAEPALKRAFRLAPQRPLPMPQLPNSPLPAPQSPDALLLPDSFTRYFQPEVEAAALKLLTEQGVQVRVLPVEGAGRTLISKGFLPAARRHAEKVLRAIRQADPEGVLPVIGLEPSEIYTLRDEFPDFFQDDAFVGSLAARAWTLEEFLVRQKQTEDGRQKTAVLRPQSPASRPSSPVSGPRSAVLLHGHCYQKDRPPAPDGYPVGVEATVAVLEAAGYAVEVVDSGCCGMAGAFGYEAEHYALSMQIGELKLLPAVRGAGEGVVIAASGISCREQIRDGAGRAAVHPVILLAG